MVQNCFSQSGGVSCNSVTNLTSFLLMRSPNAIIIGSGIAGMATAIRLALQGFDVHVYEKNTYPGGKVSAFEKEGYRFDAGPSLFTQPQNIEDLFELAGEPIESYFAYQPVEVACKYFFENKKTVQAYTDHDRFADELATQVTEDPKNVINYLKRSERTYDRIGTVFLDHSLHKTRTWWHRRTTKALSALRLGFLFRSLHNYNSRMFSSPETIQLFDRFATYNGSNPYKAPAMLNLIPHLELNQGTFYPSGGMISITDALYRLAKKKGVEFHFGKPVQRIIHHEGKVKGIVVNDENVRADIVVSNGDIYFTYKNLLQNNHRVSKLMQQERSSSAVIFYWGIKRSFAQLQLHNILFSADYKQEFKCIFKTKQLAADPTVYINITSKMESAQAPPGCENWFVMINAPANVGQNWETLKADLRKMVISKINRMLDTDIEILIATEETSDPVLIEEQTASWKGSLYGTSSNSKLSAFFRHPNFTGTIRGLYFCGGSVHPGGGIPLCLKSARIVSELIQQQSKKEFES